MATVAATQPWLSLPAGVLLLVLVLALAGSRRGIPRLLVMITLGFALVLLGAAVMQCRAGVVATTDPRTAPLSTSARYLPGAAAWVDALGDMDSDPKKLDFDLGSTEATQRNDGTTRRWPLFRLGLGPARG